MGRVWTAQNVLDAKFKGLAFTGDNLRVFGVPERAGSWIIFGHSGSGKTTFCFQLAGYLGSFEKVLYNSLEEGLSKSIQTAYSRAGLTKKSNVLLVQESITELATRLRQHKSPNIVFIDSIRYSRLNWNSYRSFCDEFPNKLFVWISHAKGREPKGALADDIRFDSPVKIYTEGFRVFATSRFSEDTESTLDIWPEGARRYWGE